MRKYFRNLYQRIALHLYNSGKLQHQQYWHDMMLKRVEAKENSRFTSDSNIINLSNDPAKIKVGKNCNIAGLLMVYSYGGQIKMGDDCSLSPLSRIVSTKNVLIGNRVLIGHNVNIIDNISHPLDAKLRHEDYLNSFTIGMIECDLKSEEIIIEDDVWIGFNSTILRGVKIGQGAIIGACSIVTKDIEPWSVNVGNPLKLRKYLNNEKQVV